MSKHPIIHVELSAKDRVAATKFYSELFGWKVTHYPEMNYSTFEAEGGVGGGWNPVSDDYPPGTVLVYIHSDDIDADLKKVEASGGKTLVPKSEIPSVGWFAIFTDPTGNKLALLTPQPESEM